jgi:hypothetical protein
MMGRALLLRNPEGHRLRRASHHRQARAQAIAQAIVVNLILQKLRLTNDLMIPEESYGSPRIPYSTEVKEAQSIRSFYVVRRYDRIPYGNEKENDLWRTLSRCGDCGVKKGQFHVFGCDLEECPICGGQAWTCSCIEASWKLS